MIKKSKVIVKKYLGVNENGIRLYGSPTVHTFVLNSISGRQETMMFGDRTYNMLKGTTKLNVKAFINENDLAYVYTTDLGEMFNGSNADYIVHSVRPQNVITTVYFYKLSKE